MVNRSDLIHCILHFANSFCDKRLRIGRDLKRGIEELVPVYQAKYVLDVNIETKEHLKSTYFEKVGLEQRWTNFDKCLEYSFEPWSGSTKENRFYNSFS